MNLSQFVIFLFIGTIKAIIKPYKGKSHFLSNSYDPIEENIKRNKKQHTK